MKCPHCLENFYQQWVSSRIEHDKNGEWYVETTTCPACNQIIVDLRVHFSGRSTNFRVYPKGISRSPLSSDIPPEYADDYKEACLVLPDSPKASAALSRRCLQNLLRGKAKVTPSDLSKEIDEVIPKLPSYLAEAIDSIRVTGNFAAHPIKSTSTGEIVEVEPGEAEENLNTLEGLFDFYFVQPEILRKKREELNTKLADAKKPPLK